MKHPYFIEHMSEYRTVEQSQFFPPRTNRCGCGSGTVSARMTCGEPGVRRRLRAACGCPPRWVGGVIPRVIDPASNRPPEPCPAPLTRAGISRSLSGLISAPITQGISTHGAGKRCWTAGITPIEIATGRTRKEASRGRCEARRPRPGAEPYTPDRQPRWPRQCRGHGGTSRASRDQPGPPGGRP